ncbi:hypothetical protein Droror1_Dr00008453 [Drosera rotundifolia]
MILRVFGFGVVVVDSGMVAAADNWNCQLESITLTSKILSKTEDNTIMEAVDPEVSVTYMNMSHVRLTFRLALLCTKLIPSERPTMKEVARILAALLPPSPYLTKKLTSPSPLKPVDYSQFLIDKGLHRPQQLQQQLNQVENSSDSQWVLRFGEVISKNTM